MFIQDKIGFYLKQANSAEGDASQHYTTSERIILYNASNILLTITKYSQIYSKE